MFDQGADIRSVLEARDKLHFHGAPGHSLIKDPFSSLCASGSFEEIPLPESLKFVDTDSAFAFEDYTDDRVRVDRMVDRRKANAVLVSPEPVSEDDMPISRMKRSPLPVSRYKSKGKRSAEDYAPVCGNNTLDPSTTISTQEPAPSWLTKYAASARAKQLPKRNISTRPR